MSAGQLLVLSLAAAVVALAAGMLANWVSRPSWLSGKRLAAACALVVVVGASLAWWQQSADRPERRNGATAADASAPPRSPSPQSPSPRSSGDPVGATPTGPGEPPRREGDIAIRMRAANPPQSNFDPRRWEFHDGDVGGVTIECRRQENGSIAEGCLKGRIPAFFIEPIAAAGAKVAEAPSAEAARRADCDAVPYTDDQTPIEEGVAYCVTAARWLAIFRIDDLPTAIPDDPTRIVVKAHVKVWDR